MLRRLRQVGWGVADQAASSVTNFALGVVVARAVDAHDFGAFAIAFTTYVTLMGAVRAVSSEPLVVRHSHTASASSRDAIAQASGTSLVLGLATGAASLVVSVLASGVLSKAFLLLGLSLPGLLLQDGWRYGFFSQGRGKSALANDVLWAVVMFSALLAVEAWGSLTLGWAITAWGGGALVAAAVGVIQTRILPRPDRAFDWIRRHRDLASRYLGEFITIDGSGQLFLYGVGGFIGLAGVGALRGATVLLGPLHVFFFGVGLVTIPEGVRIWRSDSFGTLRRMCVSISVALALAAIAWGSFLVLLPDTIGTELLGDTWEQSRRVLLPYALSMAATGVTIGASTGLRALAAARQSFRARLLSSPLQPIVGIAAAAVFGLEAAAWSLLLTSAIGSFIFWWHFLRAGADASRSDALVHEGKDPLPT